MSMGEHDLTNVIFDRAAPCGAVLTSATDALEGGADATAVVCLVRETINGRYGTDEAALFKGVRLPRNNLQCDQSPLHGTRLESRREQKVHEQKLHAGKVDCNPTSMNLWAAYEPYNSTRSSHRTDKGNTLWCEELNR